MRYAAPMQVMFEVVLAPDAEDARLLSEETRGDTGAQVLTPDEAASAGFLDIPEGEPGRERRLIIVEKRDERRIQNALEANPEVAGFRIHFANR